MLLLLLDMILQPINIRFLIEFLVPCLNALAVRSPKISVPVVRKIVRRLDINHLSQEAGGPYAASLSNSAILAASSTV